MTAVDRAAGSADRPPRAPDAAPGAIPERDTVARWRIPARLATGLTEPLPVERLVLFRFLVGAYATIYLAARTPYLLDASRLPPARFAPHGAAVLLNSPPSTALVAVAATLGCALGVAYTLGRYWRVTGPAFAAVLFALLSFGVSWGQVFHTEHLLVLHVALVACAPAGATGDRGTSAAAGFALRLVALVTALTYALAGWAKLRNGGWAAFSGDVLRNHVAFDNLRKVAVGSPASPLGTRLVQVRALWPPVALATLAIELLAPLALLGRRARLVWAASAWALHAGILAVMAIMFPYPLSGVAFAPLLPLERWREGVQRRRANRRERPRE